MRAGADWVEPGTATPLALASMTTVAQPAGIDLEDSFARLRGQSVEIVLVSPALTLPDGEASARLRKGRHAVAFSAESITDERGHRIVLTGPRAELTDGAWTVALVVAGVSHPVDARLLVQGERPVVLLWGALPLPSRLPTPNAAAPAQKAQKAVLAGRRVAERALQALPPEQALKTRRVLRKAVRRMSPSAKG